MFTCWPVFLVQRRIRLYWELRLFSLSSSQIFSITKLSLFMLISLHTSFANRNMATARQNLANDVIPQNEDVPIFRTSWCPCISPKSCRPIFETVFERKSRSFAHGNHNFEKSAIEHDSATTVVERIQTMITPARLVGFGIWVHQEKALD